MASNKEKGQALLLVVLVMIVSLTVGLSVASRSVVNVRTSSEEVDTQKALAAAEAGIEQILQSNSAIPSGELLEGELFETTNFTTNVTEVQGSGPFILNGGNLALNGDGIDVWLVNHDDENENPDYDSPWTGSTLSIYWGTDSDACDNPAVEIVVIENVGNVGNIDNKLTRYVYDPCDDRRLGDEGNNFEKANQLNSPALIGDKNFYYKQNISITSGLLVRVIPVYANSLIAVGGDQGLPTQGFDITSTGVSGQEERHAKRTINFFKSYDSLPIPFFTYGLFSPGFQSSL